LMTRLQHDQRLQAVWALTLVILGFNLSSMFRKLRESLLLRLVSAVLASLVPANTLEAQELRDVFVLAGEQGRGFLRLRGTECFLVTAAHVIKDASQADMVGADERPARASGTLRLFDDDIGILPIRDHTNIGCTAWPTVQSLDTQLARASAFLNLRERDGSLARLPISVVSVDERFFRFVPGRGASLLAGMSGGRIAVGETTLGMLVAVEGDTGIAYRFDHMSNVLQTFFGASESEPREIGLAVKDVGPIRLSLMSVRRATVRGSDGQMRNGFIVVLSARNRDASQGVMVAFNATNVHGMYNVQGGSGGLFGDCGMGKGLRSTMTDAVGNSASATSATGISTVGVGCAGRVSEPSEIADLLQREESRQGRELPMGARYAYGTPSTIEAGETIGATIAFVGDNQRGLAIESLESLQINVELVIVVMRGNRTQYSVQSVSFSRINAR
jgi:hypothetical protein